ncbi:hypothetical protein B7P43_G07669 [Cryptotermes secundus]|uniref:Uncharacterized protein n=1 Tax=Cryptotermes secundus TaxID=105785 RepID=A0A2J7RJQ7_9NEOP|nr:hypothetical protein B7P43_G07669 [Cryptotermes secundus]
MENQERKCLSTKKFRHFMPSSYPRPCTYIIHKFRKIGVTHPWMSYCIIHLDIEGPYKPWAICITKLSYKEAI